MKKSLIVAYLFIVLVPMACVLWLGWHSVESEQARYRTRLGELQMERLREFSQNQARWIDSLETSLVQLLEQIGNEPYTDWPALQDQDRFAFQLFAIDADGALAWPSDSVMPLSQKELAFQELYQQGRIGFSPGNDETGQADAYLNWSTWFEGQGEQWAAWIAKPDGSIQGVVLDRSAFISEAIAQLPDQLEMSTGMYGKRMDSLGSSSAAGERFSLVDEKGDILYNWGTDIPPAEQAPALETRLPVPLNMWKFQLVTTRADPLPLHRQPLVLFMAVGIIGVLIVTLSAAYYLYTATMKEFRQARQRVSFVNQVSHEFKTPLTNIQLYADLLGDDIEKGGENKYLNIIREESGKLNRMIQNVLTFGRSQRAALQLNPVSIVPDQLISEQLNIHKPGLERARIHLNYDPDAGQSMRLDPECLSQILGNLLSNAGKYAPDSELLVSTRQSGNRLKVVVQDTGPGIPPSHRESVFEPFVRLGNSAKEGVSGTGIGLSIARELARLHGGDLFLEPSRSGTHFVFQLEEAP